MSHQVALSFEDGVTRFITCAEDQTVADASYRARINIPLDCRDGACGTCKARCESGEYDGGTYIEDALSADEAGQGYVLPCSMWPRSDLVLQIASTSAVAKTQAATFTGTVTGLERLSRTTMAVSVEIPDRDRLTFLPGQYVNVAVPGTDESRSYSFSSAPGDPGLTFLVKLTPGGVMTAYLDERAALGDKLSFTGPHGSFFLREAARPILLLAGGTGLAPVLSILRTLRDERSTRPVHLVYGVSTDEDLVELDTLQKLAADLPQLTWDHCVSDPASTAEHRGYVTGLIGPEHLHDGDVAVYLCGPPPMVEAVRRHFADAGVEPTGFYYEKFALAGPASTPEPTTEPTPAPEPSAVVEPSPAVEPVEATPEVVPVVEPTPQVQEVEPVGVTITETHARSIAGQEMLPAAELEPLHAEVPVRTPEQEAATSRTIARQTMLQGRPDLEPLIAVPAAAPVAAPATGPASSHADGPVVGGYVIGEEHPSVHHSDALFEARQALELGALELVLGRLSSRQLAGYRLLAEATLPYVEGDRFVDAAAFTETNAAFHDYLFSLTGNEHLLEAYRALGVKGHMEETLRNATWCDPRCATDHVEIVEAVAAGDRQAARTLLVEHAARAKETTRRALDDTRSRVFPARFSPGRFAGRRVVVTGAAQGIGLAVARRIAAEGGAVALVDRAELVQEESAALTAAGATAYPVTADLEQYAGAERAVETARAALGGLDVVVNNVGGTIWAKPYEEYTPEQIQAEIQRSLFPTLWTCRAALPHLVEAGGGTIVNVSSVATRGVNRVPYAAAKGGVNAITSALALEAAAHGVRVVATAPGGTEAPARRVARGPGAQGEQEEEWYQQLVDQTVSSSLLKRYGTLDEQAAAICFLASEEASYITGTVLPVAGGDLG